MSKNKENRLNLSHRCNSSMFIWTTLVPVHTQGQLLPLAQVAEGDPQASRQRSLGSAVMEGLHPGKQETPLEAQC